MKNIQNIHEDDSSFPGPERQLILKLEALEEELYYLDEFYSDYSYVPADCKHEIENIKQELRDKYSVDLDEGKNVPIVYTDSDKLQEPRKTFFKARSLFHSELDHLVKNLLSDCHGEYFAAASELCQIMKDIFHTPVEKLKIIAINFDSNYIEQSIEALSKEYEFKYSRISQPNQEKTSGWILEKWIHGKQSELSVQFCADNSIHISCMPEEWKITAYAYRVLITAIRSWANRCV